jgi:hypothetical protein
MKKCFALLAFISILTIGSAAFATGSDVAQCAQMKMDKVNCVSMCAQPLMGPGVSDCATSSTCPMK